MPVKNRHWQVHEMELCDKEARLIPRHALDRADRMAKRKAERTNSRRSATCEWVFVRRVFRFALRRVWLRHERANGFDRSRTAAVPCRTRWTPLRAFPSPSSREPSSARRSHPSRSSCVKQRPRSIIRMLKRCCTHVPRAHVAHAQACGRYRSSIRPIGRHHPATPPRSTARSTRA